MHLVNLIQSLIRERHKYNSRHQGWKEVEYQHLVSHPTCMSCGSTKFLQVHHIQPYVNHPTLELDPTNLWTLCMGPNECHLQIGHGGDFDFWNPRVVEHSYETMTRPVFREEIEMKARAVRLD